MFQAVLFLFYGQLPGTVLKFWLMHSHRSHLLLRNFAILLSVVTIVAFNLVGRVEVRDSLPIPLDPAISLFTFGYSETLADSIWLQSLQNFRTCEQDRGGSPLTALGARMGPDRIPSCSYSWLYHMLNVTMHLAPRFKTVAEIGPMVLSSVIDDIDGATELYTRAVRHYPDDWVILSRAATHFALEIEDGQKAAQLYLRAVDKGAPVWMALYASKLSSQEGQRELAIRILKRFSDDERLTERDRKYIEEKLGAKKK